MKAVRQLIDYFRASGRLTADDLDELLRRGVIDLEERHREAIEARVQWELYGDPSSEDVDDHPDDLDAVAASETSHRTGRRCSLPPAGQHLDVDRLCAWIDTRRPEWLPTVAALDGVARRLDASAPGLTAIRAAAEAQLNLAVRDTEFGPLWDATTFAGYRDILHADGSTGPAANAYRGMTSSNPQIAGSKYAWLLRRPQVRWVHNLRAAQDLVLQVLARYAADDAGDVARALLATPRALLPFVLLHMGRTGSNPDTAIPFGECIPALSLSFDEWLTAWEIAGRMESASVARLLVEHMSRRPGLFDVRTWAHDGRGLVRYSDFGLRCPASWTFMRESK